MYMQCIDLSVIKKYGYWDEAALRCCEKETGRLHEALRIGSGLYREMFAASGYSAAAKAKLPIRQMGGMLDRYGMLQLTGLRYQTEPGSGRIIGMTAADGHCSGEGVPAEESHCSGGNMTAAGGYCFDESMEPDSPFLEEYARTVIEAYGRNGLDCPYVHQFRMYIDFHNIHYIRTHFKGGTDFQKLKAYAGKTGRRLDYSSSSRLHNRKLKKDLGTFQRQTNDKVKSRNGLSEFIVRMRPDAYGPAGQFVTQWDYLRIDRATGLIDSDPAHYTVAEYKPVVETESFNYCRNDRVKVDGMSGLHTLLDVNPANGKTGYENELKKEGKRYWAADKVYREEFTHPCFSFIKRLICR